MTEIKDLGSPSDPGFMESLVDLMDTITDAPHSARDYVPYAIAAIEGRMEYWKSKRPDDWWKLPQDGGDPAICFVVANLDFALFQLQEIERRLKREGT